MLTSFRIKYEWEIVHMRSEVRELARTIGFDEVDQARIVQSLSELARNVIQHAEEGIMEVEQIETEEKKGLRFIVRDLGPGFENLSEFMMHMKNKGIGETSGLQQVQLLMDELTIHKLEQGTSVEVTKWLKQVPLTSE